MIRSSRSVHLSRPLAALLPLILTVLAALAVVGEGTPAQAAGAVTARAWGGNWYGQLGDGLPLSDGTDRSPTPVTVVGLSGVRQVSAGGWYSLAVLADGTVQAWGFNGDGELGVGTRTNSRLPVQVPVLPANIVQVAAGSSHSLALGSDGRVWAWGYNFYGQVGDGTTQTRTLPVLVPGLTGVTQIAAGLNHSLAVRSDGSVWAWGWNSYGQLGNGTTTDRRTPVQVPGLTGITQVSAGGYHSLALSSGRVVMSWGRNAYGQLGDGTTTDRLLPQPSFVGPGVVVQVSAGAFHSLVLDSGGTVWASGYNGEGALGDGTTTTPTTPVPVPGLTGVRQVSAGEQFSLALLSDRTVRGWGANYDGNLGTGAGPRQVSPVQVNGLWPVTQISAGANHALATVTKLLPILPPTTPGTPPPF